MVKSWIRKLAVMGLAVVELTRRCRHHDAQLHVGLIVPDTSKKSPALERANTLDRNNNGTVVTGEVFTVGKVQEIPVSRNWLYHGLDPAAGHVLRHDVKVAPTRPNRKLLERQLPPWLPVVVEEGQFPRGHPTPRCAS